MKKPINFEKRTIQGIKLIFYLLALLTFFLGGFDFMAGIFIFVCGFLVGKYLEKAMSFISDYKLAQKVNKISYSAMQFEQMRDELERYKQYFRTAPPPSPHTTTTGGGRGGGGGKVPFDFNEVYSGNVDL